LRHDAPTGPLTVVERFPRRALRQGRKSNGDVIAPAGSRRCAVGYLLRIGVGGMSKRRQFNRPFSAVRNPSNRLAILALPLALAALAACDESATKQAAAPPPPVTVAKPVVKNIVEGDEFTGRFEAVASVEVRARVGGYLESVKFQDGTIVKEGDLLFVIDRRPYQAALAQAEAQAASARTRIEWTRVELERAERLTRQGVAAERTLDERRQQSQQAQADFAAARAAADQSRLDLGYTEIRAPISGRISRKLVTEGNLVAANDTLLTTIVALDPIYFYFDVDERSYLAYSRMARNGSKSHGSNNHAANGSAGTGGWAGGVETLVALADEKEPTRKGRLDFVDNRVDPSTGTMRGRAVLENKDFFLVPGLFGRIRIPGSDNYKAVLIPDEAIASDLDRRIVYAVGDDGTITQLPIRPGPRQDGYRIVRQGLTGEETIIVNGLQRTRFGGGKVTPQMTILPPAR
jgi:RND family efflux transporter MFP subunit